MGDVGGGGGQGYSKEAFILYVWGHNQGKYVIVVSCGHTPIAEEKEAVYYAALFSATNPSSVFSRRSQGVKPRAAALSSLLETMKQLCATSPTASADVTRPFPSLAERGVTIRD